MFSSHFFIPTLTRSRFPSSVPNVFYSLYFATNLIFFFILFLYFRILLLSLDISIRLVIIDSVCTRWKDETKKKRTVTLKMLTAMIVEHWAKGDQIWLEKFLLAFIPSSLSSISQFLIFFSVPLSSFVRADKLISVEHQQHFILVILMRCDAILISVRVGFFFITIILLSLLLCVSVLTCFVCCCSFLFFFCLAMRFTRFNSQSS